MSPPRMKNKNQNHKPHPLIKTNKIIPQTSIFSIPRRPPTTARTSSLCRTPRTLEIQVRLLSRRMWQSISRPTPRFLRISATTSTAPLLTTSTPTTTRIPCRRPPIRMTATLHRRLSPIPRSRRHVSADITTSGLRPAILRIKRVTKRTTQHPALAKTASTTRTDDALIHTVHTRLRQHPITNDQLHRVRICLPITIQTAPCRTITIHT